MDNNMSLVAQDNNEIYCSFSPDSVEGKKALYKAITNPDHKITDMVGKEIRIRDVVVATCQFVDEETGETTPGNRTILIDCDGVSYGCSSTGVYNALRNLIAIFGSPTWADGLTVRVGQISKGVNRIITLEIV